MQVKKIIPKVSAVPHTRQGRWADRSDDVQDIRIQREDVDALDRLRAQARSVEELEQLRAIELAYLATNFGDPNVGPVGVGSGGDGGSGAGGAGGSSGGSGDGGSGSGGSGGDGGGPGDGAGSIFILKATTKALNLPPYMCLAVKWMAAHMNEKYPGSTDLIVPEYRIRACVLIETIARRKDWFVVYEDIAQTLGMPLVRSLRSGSYLKAARTFKDCFELVERRYLGTATAKPQPGAPRCTEVGATKAMSKWGIYEARRQAKKFKGESCERFWPVLYFGKA